MSNFLELTSLTGKDARSFCGIPEITLEDTVEDRVKLSKKVLQQSEF